MFISVITTISNENSEFATTLANLVKPAGDYEIIIVKPTATAQPALPQSENPARVVPGPGAGQAAQFNTGAAQAQGDVLLFLLPYQRLPVEALLAIEQNFQLLPQSSGGNFHLKFDPNSLFAKVVSYVLKWWRYRGSYGANSAIFVRTELFEALGGFSTELRFADYDFTRRLGQHGPTLFLHEAVTVTNPGLRDVFSWLWAPLLVKWAS